MRRWFGLLTVVLLATGAMADEASGVKLQLVFFGSATCGECMEIREQLLKPLESANPAKLKIDYRDIEKTPDFNLMAAMENGYKIKNSSPQELFFPDTVLLGYDAIMKTGGSLIQSYLQHPEKWQFRHAYGNTAIDTNATIKNIRQRVGAWTMVGLFAAGFLDGVNPCAIATMIFLISFLGTQKRKRSDVLKIGLAFSGTVFITYFSMGLGAFKLLSLMSAYYWLSLSIRIIAVTFAVIVACMALRDAWVFYRTKDVKKMSVQLPRGIKLIIHSTIRGNLTSNKIVVGAIVAGFVVTLLEGACTAKIYLPTIVLMTQAVGFRVLGWLLLVFYNLLFVLPLLIVLIAAAYGLKWDRLSKFTQKHLALMNVLLAMLLFALAAFITVR